MIETSFGGWIGIVKGLQPPRLCDFRSPNQIFARDIGQGSAQELDVNLHPRTWD